MFRKMSRDFWGDVLLSCVRSADHLYKLPPRHGFKHVASSARLECTTNLNISFEGRKHNNARVFELCANGDHRINATDVGQPEVHERNVRTMFTEALYGLASTGCLSHQKHVRF